MWLESQDSMTACAISAGGVGNTTTTCTIFGVLWRHGKYVCDIQQGTGPVADDVRATCIKSWHRSTEDIECGPDRRSSGVPEKSSRLERELVESWALNMPGSTMRFDLRGPGPSCRTLQQKSGAIQMLQGCRKTADVRFVSSCSGRYTRSLQYVGGGMSHCDASQQFFCKIRPHSPSFLHCIFFLCFFGCLDFLWRLWGMHKI